MTKPGNPWDLLTSLYMIDYDLLLIFSFFKTEILYLLVRWPGYEKGFLTAGCVMNFPEFFISVVPGRQHASPELSLELVFEAGQVPVLQVVPGEVALQG